MVSPVLFVLITGSEGSWVALALWIVLCASDGIDGWLARRYGTTRSGAFLDPLADKVLVLGAMFTLVALRRVPGAARRHHRRPRGDDQRLPHVRGRHGVSVPATPVAKVKTLFQQLAVGFALLPPTAGDGRNLWLTLLWVAVVLTVVTGAQYLLAARRVATQELRRIPQSTIS